MEQHQHLESSNVIKSSRAIIVAINFGRNPDYADDLEEVVALATSAGYSIVEVITANRPKPDPTLFVGKGKADEIKTICETLEPAVLIINHNISPIQERNLDRLLVNVRVIDRTQLILDIFAGRAVASESILQIELAMQRHLRTRLIKPDANLDQQSGRSSGLGGGAARGPGETRLELDRRAIDDKILFLKRKLDAVMKQRETQRKARLKSGLPSISIVGYTNAGKSTLFNKLTKANVYAEDRLFATLHTTSRHLFIDEKHEVVLSDTVGFIRDLPHRLVAAFRATLEETVHANILLHVVDSANYAYERQIADVDLVLSEIAAATIPQLLVYNKIDLVANLAPHIRYSEQGEPQAVYLSAQANSGLDLLRQAIIEKIDYIAKPKQQQQDLVYEPWKNR